MSYDNCLALIIARKLDSINLDAKPLLCVLLIHIPETHLPESQLTKSKQPESHLITISNYDVKISLNNLEAYHCFGGS